MSSIKCEAAAIQLEALGFISVTEEGKYMRLTDKGAKRAEKILRGISIDDRLLVVLCLGDFIKEHGAFFREAGDKQ